MPVPQHRGKNFCRSESNSISCFQSFWDMVAKFGRIRQPRLANQNTVIPPDSSERWLLERTTKETPTTPTTDIKFAILIWNNRSLIRPYPSGLVLFLHIPSHITPQNTANIQSSVQFSKSDLRCHKTGQWWTLQFTLNIQWYEIL